MTSARAIIGSNWGDEGKGLGVDALAFEMKRDGKQVVVVVRSNGGAQAGHGVERPDGRRHVFHHIGAGTFAGALTHLSRFFVAHPMVLEDEIKSLKTMGQSVPLITIDPRAPVTTPWDMAINQAIEMARSGSRHGSTGLGFGETIERDETGPRLRAGDLWSNDLEEILATVQKDWVTKRLKALGLKAENGPLADVLSGRIDLSQRFLKDCAIFRRRVALLDDVDLASRGEVLFEGAQGLQLDMDYGVFPHVTRSYTGIRNMLSIAQEAGIEEIFPIYMTRAYATRHGAGPLPYEAPGPDGLGKIDFADIVDLTNAPNEWQGVIRHAPLDADLLKVTIERDLEHTAGSGVLISPSLGVTCLDQLTEEVMVGARGQLCRMASGAVVDFLSLTTGLPIGLTSNGPCRENVVLQSPSEGLKVA